MSIKALSITGGGVRGVALAGVVKQGFAQGKIHSGSFDVITGDSFGALVAALLASGQISTMARLFVETNFERLVSGWIPWKIRKPALIASPVSLKNVARFIDLLGLPWPAGLIINTWNADANIQVFACSGPKPEWAVDDPGIPTSWVPFAHRYATLGTWITRSMCLPGLVADDPVWMDGGLGEHPPLSFLPSDAHLLVLNLGFAGLVEKKGDTIPKGLIDRALYSVEVIQSTRQACMMNRFPNRYEINPKIYDVDPTAFDLPASARKAMIERAFSNTAEQWEGYKP